MSTVPIKLLYRRSSEIRARVIGMSNQAGTPHLGSSLSCIDLLVASYAGVLRLSPENIGAEDRDQLLLSKGHAAPALYATLENFGLLDAKLIDSYGGVGSVLAEQPAPNCAPGVEWATGSLGHGLGVAIGKALAAHIQGRSPRFVVVMSDGECNEGSVWEAAMFASAQKIGNLLAFVDYNKWQATARSQEVMSLDPFMDKWSAFGWDAYEVDGHDLAAILGLLEKFDGKGARPMVIIAHTVKGKGVDFMEDDNNWHYRIPTREEVVEARRQLGV